MINVRKSLRKVPVILVKCKKNLIFSTDFRKIFADFMKIRPVGTKLFHAEGRKDIYREK
jgi:hypothetical protein